MRLSDKDLTRFWAKVRKGDGCWYWTASTSKGGYGLFLVGKSPRLAHRVSYIVATGDSAEGMDIDHRCHNHVCVRPSHLRAITHKQNMENRAGPRSGSKAGIRGVDWHRASGQWRARVTHNGKQIHVGLFDTAEEAGRAAAEVRRKVFTHSEADKSPGQSAGALTFKEGTTQ
jgi:hypothetical protein